MNAIIYEEFRYITDKSVPGILENSYQISNFGYIVSTRFGKRRILYQELYRNGYLRSTVVLKNGKQRHVMIHRALMIEFLPIENYNNFVVNHKDLNKQNNIITNLEWVTQAENSNHAIRNMARTALRGENSNFSNITENQAIQICTLHNLNFQNYEISKALNISSSIVNAILSGKSWTNISCKFGIQPIKRMLSIKDLSDTEIEKICFYFQKHSNEKIPHEILYKNALEFAGKIYNDDYLYILFAIYNRELATNISCKYNF